MNMLSMRKSNSRSKLHMKNNDDFLTFVENTSLKLCGVIDLEELSTVIQDAARMALPDCSEGVVYLKELSSDNMVSLHQQSNKRLPSVGIAQNAYLSRKVQFHSTVDPSDPVFVLLRLSDIKIKKVLTYPICEQDSGVPIAILLAQCSSYTRHEQKAMDFLQKQISACYRRIVRTATLATSRNNSDILKLCADLNDREATHIQVKLLQYIQTQTCATCAFFILVEPDSLELTIQVIGDKILSEEIRISSTSESTFAVFNKSATNLSLANLPTTCVKELEKILGMTITSLLSVPVVSQNYSQPIAFMCVVNKRHSNLFTTEDIVAIETCFKYTVTVLASSLAVVNERRLKNETQSLLQVARNLFTHLGECTFYANTLYLSYLQKASMFGGASRRIIEVTNSQYTLHTLDQIIQPIPSHVTTKQREHSILTPFKRTIKKADSSHQRLSPSPKVKNKYLSLAHGQMRRKSQSMEAFPVTICEDDNANEHLDTSTGTATASSRLVRNASLDSGKAVFCAFSVRDHVKSALRRDSDDWLAHSNFRTRLASTTLPHMFNAATKSPTHTPTMSPRTPKESPRLSQTFSAPAMSPHTSSASPMSPHTPNEFTVLPDTPNLSTMLPHTPNESTMLSHTPNSPTMLPHTPSESSMSPHTPNDSTMLPHTPKSPTMLPHTPNDSTILPLTPNSSTTLPHSHNASTMTPERVSEGTSMVLPTVNVSSATPHSDLDTSSSHKGEITMRTDSTGFAKAPLIHDSNQSNCIDNLCEVGDIVHENIHIVHYNDCKNDVDINLENVVSTPTDVTSSHDINVNNNMGSSLSKKGLVCSKVHSENSRSGAPSSHSGTGVDPSGYSAYDILRTQTQSQQTVLSEKEQIDLNRRKSDIHGQNTEAGQVLKDDMDRLVKSHSDRLMQDTSKLFRSKTPPVESDTSQELKKENQPFRSDDVLQVEGNKDKGKGPRSTADQRWQIPKDNLINKLKEHSPAQDGIRSSGFNTPEVITPDMNTPELTTPEFNTPGINTPCTSTSAVSLYARLFADKKNPGVSNSILSAAWANTFGYTSPSRGSEEDNQMMLMLEGYVPDIYSEVLGPMKRAKKFKKAVAELVKKRYQPRHVLMDGSDYKSLRTPLQHFRELQEVPGCPPFVKNCLGRRHASRCALQYWTHDLTTLLREIMQEARNLTQSERCSVFLIDEETDELVAKVFDGVTTEKEISEQSEIRLPINQGIAGHVATTGELLNIKDAYSHPLFYRGIDQNTGFRTRNILCFPIKDENGKVIGVAQLCNKKTCTHFTHFDEEIASAFSVYCCISIIHSLMYKNVIDAQQRNSLANELMMYHMKSLMYKRLQDSHNRNSLSIELMLYYMKVSEEDVTSLAAQPVPTPVEINPQFEIFSFPPRDIEENTIPVAIISMCEELGFLTRWRIRKETLSAFILMARKGYRDPPYHNWMHAFSVAHFSYLLIKNLQLQTSLDEIELFALFVACICHDIDHRGTNNSFQLTSKSVLAQLYSSEGSVMERHHLAQSMCILNTEGCNIFENLNNKDYQRVLDLLKDIILATDIAHHLRILKAVEAMALEGYDNANPKHHKLLLCILMTSSDLSDQTKNWKNTSEVANLIYKEFFSQGDLEKELGHRPVEMMDRERAQIPDLQISFLNHIAQPAFNALGQLFPMTKDTLLRTIKSNKRRWELIKQKMEANNDTKLTVAEMVALAEDVGNMPS